MSPDAPWHRDGSIYVAGHDTMLGAAIREQLERPGHALVGGGGDEPDLTDPSEVNRFFELNRPRYVFVAAGKAGGIGANQNYPAELMRDNLLVACHLLEAAYRAGVAKLLYLASSCSYPKQCAQPMAVGSLLAGPLEPTSEAYAMAKLAGIKLCQAYRRQYGANFIAGIPADSFGPRDDFNPERSHVVAALIRKMHEAKVMGERSVTVWGSGAARRELIFAPDLAEVCIFVMREYEGAGPVNIAGGTVLSIRELAELIAEVVGYTGELRFDASRPDGMPMKALDNRELEAMGWRASTPLREGLAATYEWFLIGNRKPQLQRGAST